MWISYSPRGLSHDARRPATRPEPSQRGRRRRGTALTSVREARVAQRARDRRREAGDGRRSSRAVHRPTRAGLGGAPPRQPRRHGDGRTASDAQRHRSRRRRTVLRSCRRGTDRDHAGRPIQHTGPPDAEGPMGSAVPVEEGRPVQRRVPPSIVSLRRCRPPSRIPERTGALRAPDRKRFNSTSLSSTTTRNVVVLGEAKRDNADVPEAPGHRSRSDSATVRHPRVRRSAATSPDSSHGGCGRCDPPTSGSSDRGSGRRTECPVSIPSN